MKWAAIVAKHLSAIAITVALGGLISATLVRLAPGFDVDVQQLDPRLSEASIQALRQSRAADSNVFHFYGRYLSRAAHGDLGTSRSLNVPVTTLLAERLPVTLRLTALGLAVGWIAALCFAMGATLLRSPQFDLLATGMGALCLCVPAAVLALLLIVVNAPAFLAIALVVFPKVFRYSRNLLAKSYGMPHVVTARAKGLGPLRILAWHVVPGSTGPLLATAGVSVSIALGATVPVEALCGIPGIGQLAWQAALGRDLPLLVNLTVVVTVFTMLANSASDLLSHALRANA